MNPAGIIFLHEIVQDRIASVKPILRRLRGQTGNILLATTKWSECDTGVGKKREKEFSQHWSKSDIAQFLDTRESALNIVDLLLTNVPVGTPQNPHEVVAVLERASKPKPNKTRRGFGSLLMSLFK